MSKVIDNSFVKCLKLQHLSYFQQILGSPTFWSSRIGCQVSLAAKVSGLGAGLGDGLGAELGTGLEAGMGLGARLGAKLGAGLGRRLGA